MHKEQLWIDAHLHLYPQFELKTVFQHGLSHLKSFSASMPDHRHRYLLLLAETNLGGAIARLQKSETLGRWQIAATRHGFNASHPDGTLEILCGRQVNSSEGLELLIIGQPLPTSPDKSRPLKELIDTHPDHLLILPWGVGKWLGERGKLLSKLLPEYRDRLQLADNRSRPVIWWYVPQFSLAKKLGIPILRGSDPLPLPKEERAIASFGTTLNLPVGFLEDEITPLRLFDALRRFPLTPFGEPLTLLQMLRQQRQLKKGAQK